MENELQEKFLAYEELKIRMKQDAVLEKELKAELIDHVPEDEKINCEYGVIERKSRAKWTYSESTTEMADNLKDVKKEEEAKGIATNDPTVYIEYRVNK